MTLINNPATVAEVTELYLKYEEALCSNSLKVLDELFWNSPDVVRFGLAENLYGSEEIRNFRNNRPTFQLQREISHLQVITFGTDTASVTLEFRRTIDGVERLGRQSQMWHRFPQGWKVISAHVSLINE
jgi:hypothetical protein